QLNVIETNAARRTVVVSGTVAQMNKAFAVKLLNYEHEVVRGPGQKPKIKIYRVRDGFISVPETLKETISGVFGLDNRNITKRNGTITLTNHPTTPTNHPTTPTNHPTTPTNHPTTIRGLYNLPTNSAKGQTIGIVVSVDGGYNLDDIRTTFQS